MQNSQIILLKRLAKADKHYLALKEYKTLIRVLEKETDLYNEATFSTLQAAQRAILDAYLKRFSSLQDFLGAKVFPLLLEVSGLGSTKMSEVLFAMEKEQIIDSFENWIELREVRNDLEHDYPDDLEDALKELKFCVDSFDRLESYYLNSRQFAKRFVDAVI